MITGTGCFSAVLNALSGLRDNRADELEDAHGDTFPHVLIGCGFSLFHNPTAAVGPADQAQIHSGFSNLNHGCGFYGDGSAK